MSNLVNRVLTDRAQSFTTAEQAQGRANIDAQKSLTFGTASDSSITSIDGSAVGMTSVSANNNLTGNGTTASPVGLSSSLNLSVASLGTANLYYGGLYLTGNSNRQVEVRGNGISLSHPSSTASGQSSTWIYPGNILIGSKLTSTNAMTYADHTYSAFEVNTDSNRYIGRLESTALTMTQGWSPSTQSAIVTYRTVEVRQRLDSSDTSLDRYVMLYDGKILFGDSGTYERINIADIQKWNNLYSAFTAYTAAHP